MGSIISAINDDIDEYISFCKKYNEDIQYETWDTSDGQRTGVACYGKHAQELKERSRKEYKEKIKTQSNIL